MNHETIDSKLDELYKVNQFGSKGLIVEYNSIDSKLQKVYLENKLAVDYLFPEIK